MKKKFILHLLIALFCILLLVMYVIQPGGWQKSKIMGVAFSFALSIYFIYKSVRDLTETADKN